MGWLILAFAGGACFCSGCALINIVIGTLEVKVGQFDWHIPSCPPRARETNLITLRFVSTCAYITVDLYLLLIYFFIIIFFLLNFFLLRPSNPTFVCLGRLCIACRYIFNL